MSYEVVLADPPWSYTGQQDKWGAAAKFYDTMTDAELAGFPFEDFMAAKSVLFMWATSPRLDLAVDLGRGRGLTYRGVAFVWVKTNKLGQPIGAQGVRPSIVKPTCEYVLAFSRQRLGRPLPLASESIVNTVLAPKREHSRKPDEVQDRIEAMYPTARRIELFARQTRPGWDYHGNEIKFGEAA